MYFTYAGVLRVLGSASTGSCPKFCALELFYSERFLKISRKRRLPATFGRTELFSLPLKNKVQELPELLRGRGNTFRPVDVKTRPDGALYIADCANPIIQHGEVDFRAPRQDKVHKRI